MMKMNKKVDISVIIASICLLCLLFGTVSYKPEPIAIKEFSERIEVIPTPTPRVIPTPDLRQHKLDVLQRDIDNTEIAVTYPEFTSIGYYYITAYSPQETGSWETASGITLHRADYENRYTEPTTAAISTGVHSFGDLFFIREFDRVFIAEDTGSAVKGKHIDLAYTDLSSVRSFPTGYYEVYEVEYITKMVKRKDYRPYEYSYEYLIDNLE